LCGWVKKRCDPGEVSSPRERAPRQGQENQSLGRSRGGFSTKLHAVVDALGNPLRLILTPGQKSDIAQGESLIFGDQAQQVIADKGYDCDRFVLLIEENGAKRRDSLTV